MRIGYNCRFLGGPLTGVQRIAQDLFDALVRVDRTNEYVAFLCGAGGRRMAALDRPNVTVVGGRRAIRQTWRRHLWEQATLPRLARKAGLDLIHHPANTAPLRGLDRAVVSIYDLSFLAHPEWFSPAFQRVYGRLIPRIARRAAHVITCSRFSKGELVARLGLDPGRIEVVYPGVAPVFTRGSGFRVQGSEEGGTETSNSGVPASPSSSRDSASAVFGPSFVLFVGGLNPRKNLGALVDAMRLVRRDRAFAGVQLKVVGGARDIFGASPLAQELVAEAHWIECLDDADDETLLSLYRRAVCLCYPSFYEGFGLPPLEALAAGTAVVAADIPVLREVLDDAAEFVDPADPQAIARALAVTLARPDRRATLVRRGADRVARFTWDAAARQTLSVYRAVGKST